MTQARLLAIFALLAGGIVPVAAFAGNAHAYAYESVTNGDFGVIDLTTGVFTLRGNAGVGQLAGLGEGLDGTVYAVATHGHQLYSINPATGAATTVGAAVAVDYLGFGSTSTGLYGYGFDRILYSIAASTGAATALGATNVPIDGYFGFSTGSDTLYEVHNGDLYSLDVSSGAASLIGHSSTGLFGAAVTVNGILYAGSENPLAVYTLDGGTGAGTRGADVGGTGQIFYGLAPVSGAVPEAAIWGLMLVGFAAVGAAMRGARCPLQTPSIRSA